MNNDTQQPYEARCLDEYGTVLKSQKVLAFTYSAALRNMDEIPEATSRIRVFDESGQRAGEIGVEYWRQTARRR